MINFLSLPKYLTFFVLPAVCGNALATEPDGSSEAALYDAVISNLGIYLFVMVCCFTVYGIYKGECLLTSSFYSAFLFPLNKRIDPNSLLLAEIQFSCGGSV